MTKIDLGNANNEKIENLNLVALRKYACSKVNGQNEWYLKCSDCDACSVGKRVRDILESETAPAKTQIEKFDDRMEKTVDMRIEEALKHENPSQWLVDQGYYSSRDSAYSQLRKYRIRHGLTAPYENEETRKKVAADAAKNAAIARVANARDRICSLFEGTSTDDEKRRAMLLKAKPNVLCKSLNTKADAWARKYPDLEEKYHFYDATRIFMTVKYANRLVSEVLDEFAPDAFPEDDEVSPLDFLEEHGEEIEPVIDILPEPYMPYPNPTPATDSRSILHNELDRKWQELRQRKNDISEEIEKLKKELCDIDGKMFALETTIEMFATKTSPPMELNER